MPREYFFHAAYTEYNIMKKVYSNVRDMHFSAAIRRMFMIA